MNTDNLLSKSLSDLNIKKKVSISTIDSKIHDLTDINQMPQPRKGKRNTTE